uniref:Purple acid phosphatase N-terminal domain-containing protein n=1 Tax=Aegilops tauschii subsp. strangulata TaxID=200361 RepID=A0A453T6R2_AEGTS
RVYPPPVSASPPSLHRSNARPSHTFGSTNFRTRGCRWHRCSSRMRSRGSLVLLTHVLLCLVSGAYSGRMSSYVRNEFPSDDIPLEHKSLEVPKGYNAPQQVHITQGDYDGKAVIISWVTELEPARSEVFYGKEGKLYDRKAKGRMTNYTFYNYRGVLVFASVVLLWHDPVRHNIIYVNVFSFNICT